MISNQNYFINELENNVFNKNKTMFVDGVEGPIIRSEDNWFFDLSFYVTGDFNLPVNSLLCNFVSSIGTIANIPLIEKRDEPIPDCVSWKEKTIVFKSKFFVNISNVDFLKQELFDHEIFFTYGLEVNDEVLKNVEIKASNTVFDLFLSESNSTRMQTSIIYSNQNIFENDSGHFFDVNEFWQNTYGSFIINKNNVFFQYIDPEKQKIFPIKKILNLACDSNIYIENCKIKFEYKIKENEKKELLFDGDFKKEKNENLIQINSKTYYNEKSKQIELNENGIDGFYCPEKCEGKIITSFNLKNDFERKKIILIKNFTFENQTGFTDEDLKIESVFINNLENYERMFFNEI